MDPEKIIELMKDMGGGIIVLLVLLLAIYMGVAFLRIRKGRGKEGRTTDASNPAGAPMNKNPEAGEGGGE